MGFLEYFIIVSIVIAVTWFLGKVVFYTWSKCGLKFSKKQRH
jgi:hypothetical protein